MGMFDNFLKQIDYGLQAIEDGALEDKLNKVADTLDKTSKATEKKLATIADRPSELLKVAEAKKDQVEAAAKQVQSQAVKTIDSVKKAI